MTLKKDHMDAGRRHTAPEHTPRLRLKPKAPLSGFVDGAWWPHSEDLTAELPDLLSVLSVRLGPISRLTYNLTEWANAPKKLVTDGRTVRLDGYHRQPVSTVEVLGVNRKRIVLLVVSPHADPDQAHAIMMTAAGANDASTVTSLLGLSADKAETRT
jgi:hypothetical protein